MDGGTLCDFATQLKKFVFGYDDCLDVHPRFISASLRSYITHSWAASSATCSRRLSRRRALPVRWVHLGFTVILGGDHHYIQLRHQVANSVAGMSYFFVMTVSVPPRSLIPEIRDTTDCR